MHGSETLTYDISVPDGINNLSGITSVTLSISSGSITSKNVEATHFSYENFSGSEVRVIADLSDIAADSGSYTVPARVEVSGYDVGAVGAYEVTVHIG